MAKRVSQARAKLQPKLRMLANGSDEVNAIRAEHACAVTVPEALAEQVAPARAQRVALDERDRRPLAKGRLKEPSNAVVSTFVQVTRRAADRGDDVPGETGRKTNLRTAELSIEEATALADSPAVVGVQLGQPLALPEPKVDSARPRAPDGAVRKFGKATTHGFGADVLVGLIDVGGFDFAHKDFLDEHKQTRFVAIWDQGGSTRPSPAARGTSPFDYGSELRKEELDRAIAAAAVPEWGLPAYELEPQSDMSPGSHGTHVASIAAGNRGVARKAKLAGVLISIPEDDAERRRSFYDSSRLAHAVDYLFDLGDELGLPVSINVSLGTNGHAHDDSSAVNRWIDAALTSPGRSVCVAVGNAGQELPEFEGDIGYVMGRVHASGELPARELMRDLEWNVVGNGVEDVSENELEVWYGAQDRLAVRIKPPGAPWTEPVEPGQFIENRQLPDGTFVSVYNELYHPSNGANYISVYLSPQMREGAVVGVAPGQWLVRLEAREVRNGAFHAWIERDDPRRAGRIGDREAWVFPSFFSENSYVDTSTVSTLACGQRLIAVANLDEEGRRINATSSQGPTRDGRQKPDIAAPGTDIAAANGFSPGEPWVAMSGTSMASPYVAGVVGLMLGTNRELTGAQIAGIIQRTALPLPGADFSWRDDAGSGVIDPGPCLVQAAATRVRVDVT